MDISRPDLARKKKLRQAVYGVTAVMAVVSITAVVSRMEPPAPRVDRDTLYLDTVQRGPMTRQVRGAGTLVPEQIRWIPATTDGTVERIVIRPGTLVAPDTVILELSNPELEQSTLEARLNLVLHPAVPDPRIHETGYRVGAWRWPRGRFLYGAKSPFFSWTRSPASTPYCETGDSSGERAL